MKRSNRRDPAEAGPRLCGEGGFDMEEETAGGAACGSVRTERRRSAPSAARLAGAALALAFAACPACAEAAEADYVMECAGSPLSVSCTSDDLFAHIPDMEPGQVYSGRLELRNATDGGLTATICTEGWAAVEGGSAERLLDAVGLRMSCGGEEVYAGSIRAAGLRAGRNLGEIAPGDSLYLDYELSVPLDAPTSLGGLRNAVRWDVAFKGDAGKASSRGLGLPATGDDSSAALGMLTLAMSAAAAAGGIACIKKEGGSRHGEA